MSRLRRSDWREPGITRRRHGRGFTFRGPAGEHLQDADVLKRIRSLAIPPAWVDVWICSSANGHLQAVGTDEAGRRQYLYHEAWTHKRDREKYQQAQELGAALPALRSRCRRALRGRGLTQARVLATAVRLLDLGLFRIGSEEYVKANGSYGLATLKRKHVHVENASVSFEFPAKSGKVAIARVTDPLVRQVVLDLKRRRDGSPELLGWWDSSARQWVDVKSVDVNDALQQQVGASTTAKDFRTWHGSVLMAMHLRQLSDDAEALSARRVTDMYRQVAAELGNTASVARNSYVDPRIVDLAEEGIVIGPVRRQQHELVPTSASNELLRLLARQG